MSRSQKIRLHIAGIWVALTLVAFVHSLVSESYWSVWAQWSLGITIGYGLLYYTYWVGNVYLKVSTFLSGFDWKVVAAGLLVLVPLIMGGLLLTGNITGANNGFEYALATTAIILVFFLDDLLISRVIREARTSCLEQIESLRADVEWMRLSHVAANVTFLDLALLESQALEEDKIKFRHISERELELYLPSVKRRCDELYFDDVRPEDLEKVVRFVDLPFVLSAAVIAVFCQTLSTREYILTFGVGATAFHLLAFNFAFTIILLEPFLIGSSGMVGRVRELV